MTKICIDRLRVTKNRQRATSNADSRWLRWVVELFALFVFVKNGMKHKFLTNFVGF